MLALAFLMLIGTALVADGFDVHVPRQYIYFAMGFAALVETINVFAAQRRARAIAAPGLGRSARASAAAVAAHPKPVAAPQAAAPAMQPPRQLSRSAAKRQARKRKKR
jgi:hypothetical protein